jgi:hypothetical protein
MKSALLIASGIFLAAVAFAAAPAQALSMKECSAKYKEAKAAGTLNGMKWSEFRKSQCGAEAGEQPAAPPAAAEKKPAEEAAGKPASGGRAAMYARERACGKEWKADKAAGKIPVGMKWPQYWHACDQRKKAEGA